MSAITKNALKRSIVAGIYNEFLTNTSRYYYYLGKVLPWNGEDTPEAPVDTYDYELDVRNHISSVKQISLSDLSYVIRRIDWEADTVYDMYDDSITAAAPSHTGATTIETSDFYVITDEFNVYKCIFNNNGALSTSKPIGNDSTTQTYADGYKWKFMFNMPVALRNKFLNSNYMPVTTALNNQFYSNGEINSVTINNAGSGYTTATLAVSGNGFIADNPAKITAVGITFGGSGYATPPVITISSPNVTTGTELQATASCTVSGGVINSVTLTEDGYGYEDDASISVAAPFVATPFVANNSYTDGDYVSYLNNFYLVVGTGLSGSTAPTHESGTVASGAISLTFSGKQATLSITTVKTEADITAVLSSGQITGYTINDPGVGYTIASIAVTGDGTGAELTPNLSVGDIDTLQANVELQAINGTIEAIQVTNGGSNYGTVSVTITGDGTGATATATVTDGVVKKIVMTAIGSGYTFATVAITNVTGTGTGAVARAIMSPKGGHGKNAVDELFTKTLMFYSTISNEKNQGLVISNDYRQSGIIKHLKNYGEDTRFKSTNGSACFKIAATINTALFPKDTVVYQSDNNKQFLVVASFSDSILLQSIDNQVPAVGLTYRNAALDTFTAGTITNPTIDKFSGDLLFIDNRAGFQPTTSQSVAFRTIIGI